MSILRCNLYLHPGTACIIGWHTPESIYLINNHLVGVFHMNHYGSGATQSNVGDVQLQEIQSCGRDPGKNEENRLNFHVGLYQV
jgi:hypothetical protein